MANKNSKKYDLAYFQIEDEDISEAWRDNLFRDESGNISCEVFSVNEAEYNLRFTISDEISYEEFVNSKGAILIDSKDNSHILSEKLDRVSYVQREDEVCNFPAGSISIVGRSDYRASMGNSMRVHLTHCAVIM